jgi:Streptomyces sporulation and cell division protein, SsgA
MTNRTGSTDVDVNAHVVTANGAEPILLRFEYAPTEPWAVTMTFRSTAADADEQDAVTWYVARDLLRDGCTATAGIGDVVVGPADGQDGLAELQLQGNNERAVVNFPMADLTDFLDSAYRVVPAGEESSRLDIDAHLALLFLCARS